MSFRVGVGKFCVVLIEGMSLYEEMSHLNFDRLSWQEKNEQYLPMNCSKIGHSYEAFLVHTCLAEISSLVRSQQTKKFLQMFEN